MFPANTMAYDSDGQRQLDDAAMDSSQLTACKKRLGNGAMDGSAMSQWTARNGLLDAMDGLAMDGLAMDGSAIKRWTAWQ